MKRKRIVTKEQHQYHAAIHEAAHAVVGFSFGWWLNPSGVSINEDDLGYCGARHSPRDHSEEACVCQALAGSLAEHILAPWIAPRSKESLGFDVDYLEDADCNFEDDTVGAFMAMKEFGPTLSDDDLILRYRHFERRTRKILHRPEVWKAITIVAEALVERGQLYWGDEPVMVAAEMVCPPAYRWDDWAEVEAWPEAEKTA